MALTLMKIPKTLALRQIFLTWLVGTVQSSKDVLDATVQSLAAQQAKKSDSLWSMNKAALIETARKELGYTWAFAEKYTVTELRELIRRNRDSGQAVLDPFQALPVGLSKLKQDELMTECHLRSIILSRPMNRASMILAIRDDVDQRRLLSVTPTAEDLEQENPTMSASTPAATPTEEDLESQENPNMSASTPVHDYDWSLGQVDDWLMADTPSTAPTTPTPEPKAKGKSKGAKRETIQGGYTAA
jgi:hypothetical protein